MRITTDIARAIAAAAEAHGGNARLAESIGVHVGNISRWVNGSIKSMSDEYADKIMPMLRPYMAHDAPPPAVVSETIAEYRSGNIHTVQVHGRDKAIPTTRKDAIVAYQLAEDLPGHNAVAGDYLICSRTKPDTGEIGVAILCGHVIAGVIGDDFDSPKAQKVIAIYREM